MNDHLTNLEHALSDATEREYGHGTARMPKRGRRPPRRLPAIAIAAALMILAASAAAAIVALGHRGSAPLTGTVPTLRILHYDVAVTPDIEPGNAGWCSYPRFSIEGIHGPFSGGGTCAPAYTPSTPVLLAGAEPLSNSRDLFASAHKPLTAAQGNVNLFWAIVEDRVGAIRLQRGLTVAAKHDPRLPSGWKAVVTFLSGQIDPVALNSSGHVLHETAVAPQLTRAATRPLDARSVHSSNPCSIRTSPLPWVKASWQVIATRAPTLGSAVEPNVLFSCARSWYSIKGSSEAMSAAILLSARDPRRPAPPLPGLTPTGQPGVFTEDGGASGPILAKRASNTWLVVQGPSLAKDGRLLDALHAEGSAVAPGRRAG
jgi:hypothetical protein